MREITLDDVTQDAFDEESRMLIDLMRTKYPKLDLRNGTVLRDLLINPDATIGAWFEAQKEEQRQSSSLKTLQERSDDGETIDPSDVSAILSNFGMELSNGIKARGKVRVNVSENRTYVVADGFEFTTLDGIAFRSDGEFTVGKKDAEVTLYDGATGYFFLIPVTAVEPGAAGNLQKGETLNPKTSFYGFVTAVAADNFSGGADVEDIGQIIARIPQAVSQRGLLTSVSAEGQLRQKFDSGENPIVAVSAVGYGNPAQLRDRHNALGVGVGGRVDLYVRNFTETPVYSNMFTFEHDGDNHVYSCSIPHSSVPAVSYVISVSRAEKDDGSYDFNTTYSASAIEDTWHDISIKNDAFCTEAANTIWRDVTITISESNVKKIDGKYPRSVDLYVELAALTDADYIQEYVDDVMVRNVGSDFIVRCPMIVDVEINAIARVPAGVAFSESAAAAAISRYVNESGFVRRLTRSEVACIIQAFGATSVPLTDYGMLTGTVYDAHGTRHTLRGDSLELSEISNPQSLLTPDTCVFVCTPEKVHIQQISN